MGPTLKGKNLLPQGLDSFLAELTLFQKGLSVEESKQEFIEVISIVKKNGGKSTKCIQFLLPILVWRPLKG